MSPVTRRRRFLVTLMTGCQFTREIDAASPEHAVAIAEYLFEMSPGEHFTPSPDEIVSSCAELLRDGEGA